VAVESKTVAKGTLGEAAAVAEARATVANIHFVRIVLPSKKLLNNLIDLQMVTLTTGESIYNESFKIYSQTGLNLSQNTNKILFAERALEPYE
jgi:hypothetical protein